MCTSLYGCHGGGIHQTNVAPKTPSINSIHTNVHGIYIYDEKCHFSENDKINQIIQSIEGLSRRCISTTKTGVSNFFLCAKLFLGLIFEITKKIDCGGKKFSGV